MTAPAWWRKPRKISIVVDNESWILPFARRLVDSLADDEARLCRTHEEIMEGSAAFYLGCVKIAPPEILMRNRRNLVVHASDLPKGRGFSPWTYAILEGQNDIVICLIEAAGGADEGGVIYKERISLIGSELVDDLRCKIGEKTLELCLRFLQEPAPIDGKPQTGEASYYKRRYPRDSRINPEKTIAEQFDFLRVVDNDKYPAFFEYRGRRYKLAITAHEKENPDEDV